MGIALLLVSVVVAIAAAMWVSKDAEQRGLSGAWTIATLIWWPSVFAYLVKRRGQPVREE